MTTPCPSLAMAVSSEVFPAVFLGLGVPASTVSLEVAGHGEGCDLQREGQKRRARCLGLKQKFLEKQCRAEGSSLDVGGSRFKLKS